MKIFKLCYCIALAGLVAIAAPNPVAHAQTAPSGYLRVNSGAVGGKLVYDTVTTVAKHQDVNTTGYWDQLFIQASAIKISGTAGGVIRLFGSIDGVNYTTRVNPTDSLLVANSSGTQVKLFDVGVAKFPYYRLVYTPTGTMSVRTQSIFFTRYKPYIK